MLLHLILGSAALMAGLFTGGLALVIVGVRRGDRGKRLTSQPVGRTEAIARRILISSRGCDTPDDTGEGR
jgi:hypothetical protein